jgi:hypothetical protein
MDTAKLKIGHFKKVAVLMAIAAVIRNTLTILLLIFIVLKLIGTIAWSWWWVISPFWIPLTIAVFSACVWYTRLSHVRRDCKKMIEDALRRRKEAE